jgi:hypothetical protein
MGWVCENHPDRAWDKEMGCECGAGMLVSVNAPVALNSRISKVIEERN